MIQSRQDQQPQPFLQEPSVATLDYPYRFPYQKYAQWKKHLQQQGFVVIANWLSQWKCQQSINKLWDIMEYLSEGKLDRNEKKTQILGKNYPPVLHGGMIQYIGHSEVQWELRKLCKPIFQKIWDTDSVKTSFDGFCFMNGIRNYKKFENNSFLHSDQSPQKNYLWSYQGIMCLTQDGEQGGGFVVVPKSHLYHRQYFQSKGLLNHKDNWYLFPEADKTEQPVCNDIKINNRAGDFILFDSRAFHCNTKPKDQSLRICTYICMIPEDRIPQKTKILRKKALKQRRTSNHHSGDGFKTFPIIPRYLEDPEGFKEMLKVVNGFKLEQDQQIMEMI